MIGPVKGDGREVTGSIPVGAQLHAPHKHKRRAMDELTEEARINTVYRLSVNRVRFRELLRREAGARVALAAAPTRMNRSGLPRKARPSTNPPVRRVRGHLPRQAPTDGVVLPRTDGARASRPPVGRTAGEHH